jgi:hypothetical protein
MSLPLQEASWHTREPPKLAGARILGGENEMGSSISLHSPPHLEACEWFLRRQLGDAAPHAPHGERPALVPRCNGALATQGKYKISGT